MLPTLRPWGAGLQTANIGFGSFNTWHGSPDIRVRGAEIILMYMVLSPFAQVFLQNTLGILLHHLWISGSAVETFFSQYKHSAGGKLDAANYSSARAANLIKQIVATHHSGKDYKDKELSTPVLPLQKKLMEKNYSILNRDCKLCQHKFCASLSFIRCF